MNHYQFFMRVCPPLALCLLLALCSSAQTVLFQETMGMPTANTPIAGYTGFDNYGSGSILFSSTSTTDVRSSAASDTAYYDAASGAGNIFINDTNEDFRISGIPVAGYTDLSLSFGLWKGSIAEDGSSLTVEVIIDGGTPVTVPVSLPTGPGTAVWHYQTPVLNLSVGSTLSLHFNGESSSAFRIDDILIQGTASPTPVVLRSFIATRTGREVQLEWETAQEKSSAYYEIQSSSDGRSFLAVARIPSRNNPQGARYRFTDPAAGQRKHYYRLQMVDVDGASMYSPVRMVASASEQVFRLLENPVSQTLKIRTGQDFSGSACLFYNLAGREFFVPLKREGELLTADVSGLPPGIYLVSFEGRDRMQTLRFLKR